jgi:anti-sigma factor RsiW
MTCKQLVERLMEYVGDELTPEDRQQLESHLCNCRPCIALVESYSITIRMTRKLPRCAPLPPTLEAKLRQTLLGSVGEPPAGSARP